MIIITGGAGFIGSNLVAALQKSGVNDIVVCDRFGSGDKWRNLAKREVRDIVAPEDIWEFLERYKGKITTIFHLGAKSSTTEYDSDLVISANFTFSRNLWKYCANEDVRFIYASSAATYGDGSQGFVDAETPEELDKLVPLHPNAWSKHLLDFRIARIAKDKNETAPPQWVGLKFFSVYGPNEYHKGEQQSVVCKLYPQIIAGANAKLFKSYHPDYKDGGQLRDFVYVNDCVDVLLWFYENRDKSGIYNVGSGKARSFNDLAKATFAATGMAEKIQYTDMPEDLKDKYQYYTEASMSKLRDAGYDKPFTDIEEGVKDYVQNYLSQKDKYK